MKDEELEKLEEQAASHWWYAARRRLLVGELERAGCKPPTTRILDLASASAHTLQTCASYGRAYGIDLAKGAVEHARRKRIRNVAQGDVQHLPFAANSFDVVVALDVFEHIDDDLLCLREVRRVLEPNGVLVFNVPAFMMLFSDHDTAFHHLRRYRRTELLGKLRKAGLQPGFASYWSWFAFPGVFVGRKLLRTNRTRVGNVQSDFHMELPRPLERLLSFATHTEVALLQAGWRLPFGVSLFGTARKPA